MLANFVQRLGVAAGLIVMTATLCGCPHMNTYGTPRTVPAGKIAHTVALEGFNISGKTEKVTTTTGPGGTPTTTTSSDRQSFTLPTLPTYMIRVGLGDRIDIGGKVANLSSLGVDLKWNFIKSESFDMAIDPGGQFFAISGTTGSGNTSQTSTVFIFYGHLPLMLGFNLNETFSIIATPGVVLSAGSASSSSGDRDALTTSTGLWGRMGIGFNFRASKGFAIQPEVTAMRQFEKNEVMMVLFGIGFNFGKLPDFSPGSENDPGEEENAKKPDPNAPAKPAAPAETAPAQPAPAQ